MALLSKSSAATPPSPVELFQALARKSHGIRERQKALVALRVKLEQDKILPVAPTPPSEHTTLVAEIVNGYAPKVATTGSLGQQLHSIILEMDANESALHILESEEVKARAVAVSQVMTERGDDWISIVRERAAAVIALRKANRKAQEFRKAVTKAGGMIPSLVCDRTGGPVFANGVSDPGYEFLQECVRRKILSEKEVANAL